MAPLAAVLLVLLHGSALAAGACSNASQVALRLDALLAEYDRAEPPARRPAQLVRVALDVRHASVDETAATARLLADFRMWWYDMRLSWNASEWECDSVLVSAERLWRPDVGVLSVSARAAADAAPAALLDAAGRVSCVERLDLEAPMAMDLSAWPRDEHRITFKFGSRAYFIDEIELSVENLTPALVFEAGAWDLKSTEWSESRWERAGGEQAVARCTVTLRRRAAAHALAAGAALTAAALLLLAAALTPPAARAPLCAAASFTAALWLASAVPRVSGGGAAPRVVALVGALCAGGGAAAAAAAAALRVARCSRPPPRALRSLLAGAAAAALRTFSPLEVDNSEESSAWAAAAQLLDALALLALVLAVLVVLAIYL